MCHNCQADHPDISYWTDSYRSTRTRCSLSHTPHSSNNTKVQLKHYVPVTLSTFRNYTLLTIYGTVRRQPVWLKSPLSHPLKMSWGCECDEKKRQDALTRIEPGKHTWTWPLLAVEKICCLHTLLLKGNDRLNWTEKDISSRLFGKSYCEGYENFSKEGANLNICFFLSKAAFICSCRLYCKH